MLKNVMLWLVIALVLMAVFSNFGTSKYGNIATLYYSEFIGKVRNKEVKEVTIVDSNDVQGTLSNSQQFATYAPYKIEREDVEEWVNNGVTVKGRPKEQQGLLVNVIMSWLPIILIVGVWVFFMRQMQIGGGGRGAMSFGRSRARLMGEDQIKVTFADVAGVEEAKEEVSELVEFLRSPGKFHELGGKIPSGVLMVGPPGTGKTLLARAIAGEAKVPFFTISGSDFVEMFVGVGASRVRDMFEQAKKHAPCIIFIDEIDAVGRHRGAGLGGGHDEREQTLNQLLVEMDGFEGNEGVIVIAATNRPDVLDPALLRPGRFDRQVVVSLPDIKGRDQILRVHMKRVPLDDDVEPMLIARGTPGLSGADLANVVNEAALFAARDNKRKVSMQHFELAKDKILMGVERKSMVMTEEERRNTAYHEAGHTIVGYLMPDADPIYKVTIIPRGRALGVTFQLPERDHNSLSKQQLESRVAVAFGGRIAEELIFGKSKVTTGAENDIRQATHLCRSMVTRWGLSEKLGPLAFGDQEDEVFLGHSVARRKDISNKTAQLIDEEIRVIVDRNYAIATDVLKSNIDKLHIMAATLLKYETLDSEQVKDIMDGKEAREPKGWTGTTRNRYGTMNSSSNKNANADGSTGINNADPAQEH